MKAAQFFLQRRPLIK